MYFVFTRMPCESYSIRLRSLLLYLCYVGLFRALVNSLVCCLCTALFSRVNGNEIRVRCSYIPQERCCLHLCESSDSSCDVMARFPILAMAQCRRDLSDGPRLANKHTQAKHTTPSTESYIQQFRIVSFR